jgi:hypothetical protein
VSAVVDTLDLATLIVEDHHAALFTHVDCVWEAGGVTLSHTDSLVCYVVGELSIDFRTAALDTLSAHSISHDTSRA